MNVRTFITAMFLCLALVLALPPGASAEVVGTLTQVEGRVDLLKGGNLPATPVKMGDGVEKGDVLRTKSLSKAQITFLDKTTLALAPESRIAIEEYMFDEAKGKRSALLQVFQGMVMAVVSKIYQTEQPDFVVKTHTAIMGIRGTEVGILCAPNSSQFLNFQGHTRLCNRYPEIPGCVDLFENQSALVGSGLPPTLPFEIGPEDRKLFMHHFDIALIQKPGGGSGMVCTTGSAAATASCSGTTLTSSTTPTALASSTGSLSSTVGPSAPVQVIITPTVQVQQTSTPAIANFTFWETFSLYYTKDSASPFSVATFNSVANSPEYPNLGTRTGVYAASFTTAFNIVATSPTGIFSSFSSGSFSGSAGSASAPITVSGLAGGTLTGTMTMLALTDGGTSFTFTGPVTLQANGDLTFATTGTFAVGGVTGTTTGTLTQTATSVVTSTSTATLTPAGTLAVTQASTGPITPAAAGALKLARRH